MSSINASHSPTFSSPPVVETVLAVQSNEVRTIGSKDFVEFWQLHVKDNYSCDSLVDAEKLDRIFEPKRLEPAFQQFQFGGGPVVGRYMMSSQEVQNRLLQMQSDRLAINWKTMPGLEYTRYRDMAPLFVDFIDAFRQFCIARKKHIWVPDLYEVTYVNRLTGIFGQSPTSVISEYLVGIGDRLSIGGFLPEESIALSRTYLLPSPDEGRVHVSIAQELTGPIPSFIVNIVSRLHAKPEAEQSIDDGLTKAHDYAVKTFLAITRKESHIKWGLQDDL